MIAESGLPWTNLRATQFYDLILAGARPLVKLPVPTWAARTCALPPI